MPEVDTVSPFPDLADRKSGLIITHRPAGNDRVRLTAATGLSTVNGCSAAEADIAGSDP
jgi:hypothetical protein